MFVKCAVLASAVFFSVLGFTAEHWHSGKIKSIYPLGNGSFVLIMSSNHASCRNGNNPQYFYVVAGPNEVNADGVRNLLSVSLAAAAQEKVIVFAFDDATDACYVNRLSVSYN